MKCQEQMRLCFEIRLSFPENWNLFSRNLETHLKRLVTCSLQVQNIGFTGFIWLSIRDKLSSKSYEFVQQFLGWFGWLLSCSRLRGLSNQKFSHFSDWTMFVYIRKFENVKDLQKLKISNFFNFLMSDIMARNVLNICSKCFQDTFCAIHIFDRLISRHQL